MPTVARYALEQDALRRAAEEPELRVEHRPSERWPEYPWAVARELTSLAGEMDRWAARLLEQS